MCHTLPQGKSSIHHGLAIPRIRHHLPSTWLLIHLDFHTPRTAFPLPSHALNVSTILRSFPSALAHCLLSADTTSMSAMLPLVVIELRECGPLVP